MNKNEWFNFREYQIIQFRSRWHVHFYINISSLTTAPVSCQERRRITKAINLLSSRRVKKDSSKDWIPTHPEVMKEFKDLIFKVGLEVKKGDTSDLRFFTDLVISCFWDAASTIIELFNMNLCWDFILDLESSWLLSAYEGQSSLM